MNDNTELKKFEATMFDPVVPVELGSTRFNLWKHLLAGFLKRAIKTGTLTLTLPDASSCQSGSGNPCVAATITSPRSLRRIALNPNLATGEAYMDGTLRIDRGGIYGFLDITLGNIGDASSSSLRRTWLALRSIVRLLNLFNPARFSQRSVEHRYDLADQLYELFF